MKNLTDASSWAANIQCIEDSPADPINEEIFETILQALANRTKYLKDQLFAAGTKMVFVQASAPAGWTKVVDAGYAGAGLRIVTDATGGNYGGVSDAFAGHTHTTPNHTHGHTLSAAAHTLTTAEIPSHAHTVAEGASTGGGGTIYTSGDDYTNTVHGLINSGYTGGGGAHTHGISGSISSGGASTTGAFTPKYVNTIVATKD